MKMLARVLLFAVILSGWACSSGLSIKDDDFLNDLASENNRTAATLLLDVYTNGLDSLLYDTYIQYLSQHEAYSAQGLALKIQKADGRYFRTNQQAFLILLYYRDDAVVVGDNSATAFIDTVFSVTDQSESPDLEQVAASLKF